MHYSELHGDLPINALQAFGGYLAMGDMLSSEARTLISQHKGDLKKALKIWLDNNYKNVVPLKGFSDTTGFGEGLLAFVDAAGSKFPSAKANEIKAMFAKSEGQEYWSSNLSGESDDAKKKRVEAILVKATKLTQEGVDEASGMSTTTKVLIGLGIAAVVGGGIYYYKTRNDD